MNTKVNLEDKVKEIGGRPFYPVEVARANDQVIRMSLVEGEFHWHKHVNEDELFFVYRGSVEIQYRDRQNVVLNEGEMAVVPRSVEHCPRSIEPSYVLLFEPSRLDTRGD
jgi:mannose-6-phosphate isomerase-like protein (cupin superfamily)